MIRLDHRLALGNFDGFHQGHQAVVGAAIEWARREGRPAIVATFDPHPVRYFHPDADPFRLTTLDQRQELFAAAGADAMLVFHFDAEIAGMIAERWVREMIHGHLGIAGVTTGEDFVFGKDRSGNAQALRHFGEPLGISTHAVAGVSDEEGPISSSRIRAALKDGDCETATRLLTRPFAIRGLVQGAANLGVRPTFDPPKELLEPYFFDFSGDLYGREIEVAFHHFLRPEARFDSLDALTAQMERDCDEARRLLANV
jgi:riboflavin kinase / FMN adenylyltransferase